MSPSAEPSITRHIVTDVVVSQVPWWSRRLTVLPAPRLTGRLASLEAAARALVRGANSDVFISGNPRNALVLGLLKRVTGRRRPLLMMTELRLDDPQPTMIWRAKVALQRVAYAAADVLCVSARREIDAYAQRLGLPPARFRFIPWHTNVLEPRSHAATGPYLFAAGRTSRDWPTLAAAAQGLEVPFVVVCSAADARRVPFPPNVTVLTDVPYTRYRELLEGARAVVVPLEDHVYSSGQVVILEAMALGKPLITARVLGTEDYVVDGVDGLLTVPGDASSLRAAITRLLAEAGLAERLGAAALAKVTQHHTLDGYVRALAALAEDLSAGGR